MVYSGAWRIRACFHLTCLRRQLCGLLLTDRTIGKFLPELRDPEVPMWRIGPAVRVTGHCCIL